MEKILVIDYGSQYTHLLARNIRRLNVYSEIKQPDVTKKDLKDVKGIILSGGPNSVYEKNAPKISKKILESGIPILGVCYGHQLISHMLGGKLERGDSMEYGFAMMKTEKNPLFKGLLKQEVVWMSHGDHVKELPEGFQSIGYTDRCQNAAVCNKEKNIFGLQFHPE
ncbi:MAG: glutamine-hydrolyzing GMP synthase, partial [Nanoarchaeota archaeon]|nr:glutamine-hydrolyzing GMP synthase [Nanoarchaeota archaeon]